MPLRRRRLPAHRRLQSRRLGSHLEKLEVRRVFAASVGLDPSFGSGGIVTTDLYNGGSSYATAVATQPDGKTLLGAGHLGMILRANSDGSPDESFGDQGAVNVPVKVSDIAVQEDGSILASGGSVMFSLARYRSDGSLDSTFGDEGMVMQPVPGWSGRVPGDEIALTDEGKILVAGSFFQSSTSGPHKHARVLTQFLADGRLDTSFGESGFAFVRGVTNSPAPTALVVQSDGKIVAGTPRGFFARPIQLRRHVGQHVRCRWGGRNRSRRQRQPA
jgi:uncharacterized delta-60 repeat protein